MNFIKKIFKGKIDEDVHRKFTRFGKGVFEYKAICRIKVGSKVKVNTTLEYANDLTDFFCSLAEKFQANGKIILREGINLEEMGITGEKKEKKGLYEIEIDQELTREQINQIKDKVYFFLLNLNFPDGELKVKQKLPRSSKAKPGKIDDRFCVAVFDKKWVQNAKEEFFFDVNEEFKSASAEHTFKIKEIVLPEKIENYEQARLEAKRKGRIIRKLVVDGKEQAREMDFVA